MENIRFSARVGRKLGSGFIPELRSVKGVNLYQSCDMNRCILREHDETPEDRQRRRGHRSRTKEPEEASLSVRDRKGCGRLRDHQVAGHWLDTYHTFSIADYYDPKWMGFRSLRVINDDLVMPGKGFGTHPHRDMEILTYVLSGSLAHKDSMGNGRVIRSGEVQYMAAGTGVEHSEFNPAPDEAAHFLQIWIVPDKMGVKPAYADKAFAKAPRGRLNLVASKSGRDGSFGINQDADLYLPRLDAGTEVSHALQLGRHAWLHVAEAEVEVNGTTLKIGDAASLSDESRVNLVGAKPSQVLLFDLN
jgi:quercetin 2,3-dioxygenase